MESLAKGQGSHKSDRRKSNILLNFKIEDNPESQHKGQPSPKISQSKIDVEKLEKDKEEEERSPHFKRDTLIEDSSLLGSDCDFAEITNRGKL